MLTWSYSEEDELWQHDEFKTEKECILDAKENYRAKSGEKIAIGTVSPYIISADVESILEKIEEDAYEECGEASESWGVSSRRCFGEEMDDLQEKITELVNVYLEKIGEVPAFYKINNIYTTTIN